MEKFEMHENNSKVISLNFYRNEIYVVQFHIWTNYVKKNKYCTKFSD